MSGPLPLPRRRPRPGRLGRRLHQALEYLVVPVRGVAIQGVVAMQRPENGASEVLALATPRRQRAVQGRVGRVGRVGGVRVGRAEEVAQLGVGAILFRVELADLQHTQGDQL